MQVKLSDTSRTVILRILRTSLDRLTDEMCRLKSLENVNRTDVSGLLSVVEREVEILKLAIKEVWGDGHEELNDASGSGDSGSG